MSKNHPGRLDGAQSFGDSIRLPIDVLEQLFSTTAKYWRSTGSADDEVYFSVVTAEEFRKDMRSEDKSAFFESGKFYVERVLRNFEKFTGKSPAAADFLDFGCGVGRLAVTAMPHVNRLYGVDFSATHLNEAAKNVASTTPAGDFKSVLLKNVTDLSNLPAVDCCYSFIALQHNTPPVIYAIVDRLLACLNPGGLAVLHIPLAMPDYQFDAASYLADSESGNGMEIHILPKSDLNVLAERNGCQIVFSECIGGVDIAYSEDIVFKKKD